jgi:hypothetical protein
MICMTFIDFLTKIIKFLYVMTKKKQSLVGIAYIPAWFNVIFGHIINFRDTHIGTNSGIEIGSKLILADRLFFFL